MAEKWANPRRHPRVKIDLDIRAAMTAAASDFIPAKLKILGGGGAFLETSTSIATGERVTLHFELPLEPPADILCDAEVRYVIEGKGIGLQFMDLDPGQTASLTSFVRNQLDDGAAPA